MRNIKLVGVDANHAMCFDCGTGTTHRHARLEDVLVSICTKCGRVSQVKKLESVFFGRIPNLTEQELALVLLMEES